MPTGELPIPGSNRRFSRPRAAAAPAGPDSLTGAPGARPAHSRARPPRPARAPTGQKGRLVFAPAVQAGLHAPRQVSGRGSHAGGD